MNCPNCDSKLPWQFDSELQCPECKKWWEIDWDMDWLDEVTIEAITEKKTG